MRRSRSHPQRTVGGALGALAGVLIVLVGLAAPAFAARGAVGQQQCDPAYGCPPGQPPPVQASCSLSASSAAPGEAVSARIEHVAAGTHVTLTFDGAAVGDATTDGSGAAAINWVVPSDASDGDHNVAFVGESVYCDASANGFRVVVAEAAAVGGGGRDVSRSDGSSAPESSSNSAQGTVGGAAGRAPRSTPPTASAGGGASPVVVAVAVTVGVAAVGGGAAAGARIIIRRRRLRP